MSRDIELEALAKGLVNAKQDTHGWPTVEYLRGAQDAGKEMLAILAKPSPGTLHGELRELADKKAWDVASHIWTDILRQRGEYEGWFDDQVAAKELILSAFLASHPAPDPVTLDPGRAMRDVLAERKKQDAKWGEQNHDPFLYLTILMEEVGELSQAALHKRFGGHASGHIREEAVHTASVALAIIECLDRGNWSWGGHALLEGRTP